MSWKVFLSSAVGVGVVAIFGGAAPALGIASDGSGIVPHLAAGRVEASDSAKVRMADLPFGAYSGDCGICSISTGGQCGPESGHVAACQAQAWKRKEAGGIRRQAGPAVAGGSISNVMTYVLTSFDHGLRLFP